MVPTPDGAKFLDVAELKALTGHPVRVQFKNPDDPDVLPPADAMVIAPATFNTINKLAHGISDTLALGLLNEAVGLGLPITAVPWPNAALARHPAFRRSVAELLDWGLTVILDPARLPDAGDEPAFSPGSCSARTWRTFAPPWSNPYADRPADIGAGAAPQESVEAAVLTPEAKTLARSAGCGQAFVTTAGYDPFAGRACRGRRAHDRGAESGPRP